MSELDKRVSDVVWVKIHKYFMLCCWPDALWVMEHVRRVDSVLDSFQLRKVGAPVPLLTVLHRRVDISCVSTKISLWQSFRDDIVDAIQELARRVG
jgi:hypothetical protein